MKSDKTDPKIIFNTIVLTQNVLSIPHKNTTRN